jgi:hypothetical protein
MVIVLNGLTESLIHYSIPNKMLGVDTNNDADFMN